MSSNSNAGGFNMIKINDFFQALKTICVHTVHYTLYIFAQYCIIINTELYNTVYIINAQHSV